MSRKAWVVTVTKPDSAPEIFEYVSARRKIGEMEEYLCDLYEYLHDQDHPDIDVDEDALKSHLVRVSGIEVCLEKAPYRLLAQLAEMPQE